MDPNKSPIDIYRHGKADEDESFYTPKDALSPMKSSRSSDPTPFKLDDIHAFDIHMKMGVKEKFPLVSRPPDDDLPSRPQVLLCDQTVSALDSLTRDTLVDILRDLIQHIDGPLPLSLQRIFLSKSKNGTGFPPYHDNFSFSDLASTEIDAEELIRQARRLSIPNYEELVPQLGKKSEPKSYPRRSSLTLRIRRFSSASELPPIPEKVPALPNEEAEILGSLNNNHPTDIPRPVRISSMYIPISTANGITTRSSDLMTSWTESPPLSSTTLDDCASQIHYHCSHALAQIELFLVDNLEEGAHARFIPSIYVSKVPSPDVIATDENLSDQIWYKESIPIALLSTAGYCEDECEVYLRAQCLRTGIIGLCRLSQVISTDESGLNSKKVLNEAYRRLWKLHPL